MKKTRLLIALLVMLVAASGYAQDSYREAVKEYMAVNSQEALNNYWNRMDSVLKANNTYWFESGDVDLNQLTERYFKEGIMDYMTDFMCAKTKELGVTEAGLREYISLMSTPEGQTYKEHMAQWVEAIKRDTTVLNGQDSLDSLKIMAGQYRFRSKQESIPGMLRNTIRSWEPTWPSTRRVCLISISIFSQ